MNKLDFERMLNPLIDIISDIENDLILDIINRINNYDGVKGSLKWYTDKLAELKILDKNSVKAFEKNKNKLEKIIKNIAESSGYKVNNLDRLQEYYNSGKINTNPFNLFDSIAINKMINDAIKDTNDIMKLIQTKAIEGTNRAYKDILNKAYVETASGIYTYSESIRRALNSYGKTGIKAAHYESGISLSIESVVRRDIIARMNKLVGDVELQHAKDLGTNLVYVDQHLGARVRTKYTKHDYEAHAEWQGKKYMIIGTSEKYPNLYDTTGYGEMLGLKGINCYHDMRPTWEWEKIDDEINSKENEKTRKLLDNMRNYERKIRELKRSKNIAKATNDTDKLNKINSKQKIVNAEYNDWLKEKKLTRDYNREYVSVGKNSIYFYEESSLFGNQTVNNLIHDTKLIISDRFQERTTGLKIVKHNKKFSYINLSENKIYLKENATTYDLIHELGHKLQENFTNEEYNVYNKIISSKFAKYKKSDFELRKGVEPYWVLKDNSEFVSKYQSRICQGGFNGDELNSNYALEYFSEGIMYYYKNPDLLKDKDLVLYKFIKKVVD